MFNSHHLGIKVLGLKLLFSKKLLIMHLIRSIFENQFGRNKLAEDPHCSSLLVR